MDKKNQQGTESGFDKIMKIVLNYKTKKDTKKHSKQKPYKK